MSFRIWVIPFLFLFVTGCSDIDTKLFKKIYSYQSGLTFNNSIKENDSINPLDLEFLYNGGGIAVGDFNRDSLPDLYFTANTSPNKLFLNKGGLSFTDITKEAGVEGKGRWSNAATVIDINNDGWPDLYVCTTIYKDIERRTNLLYVNQGLDKNGIPTFREMASEYGLADISYSVQALFLDYDHDDDLDLYLITTKLAKREGARIGDQSRDSIDKDKFFRNDWNSALKHPVFTNITDSAHITGGGFGLSGSVCDMNNDGWPDVYVANDFFGSDALWINQGNGTFQNKIKSYFKHISQNAMGNDVADINNDGLFDVLTVDMNPEDNYRKKKNLNSSNYYVYQDLQQKKITLQYVRNTLQLNQGPRVLENDSVGDPVFADISFAAGVAQTDWSWNPSIADFDNDGWRDILITNGYPRDVTDHDFVAFRATMGNIATKEQLIDEIPQIKIPNYAFKNTNGTRFENVTDQWGLSEPSFSCGAVYCDLDNDGDLDYVVSNINEEVTLYENKRNDNAAPDKHWLTIQFKGTASNPDGIGSLVEIHHGTQKQIAFNNPVHGYLSCIAPSVHFGLGKADKLDSIIIKWPSSGKKQLLINVKPDTILTANVVNAKDAYSTGTLNLDSNSIFVSKKEMDFVHAEPDNIDFNRERLLPHKLSEYSPGLAVGDVNADGLEDLFVGGNAKTAGSIFIQLKNGGFRQQSFSAKASYPNESRGLLLFDADGDGDNDLYCVSGSNEFEPGGKNYLDVLYVNDGKGNFLEDSLAVPLNTESKSCVKAVDLDNDGDLDLFIGGRMMPGRYGEPVNSFIYRNDSEKGKVRFTDITDKACPALQHAGLVCDAIWSDFNGDGFPDLVVAGEWMALRFFQNDRHGILKELSTPTGINDQTGWWNSIAGGDFDNDGDIDYIAGNQGQNTFFQPSMDFPVKLYYGDFDKNGSLDPILTVFLKDSLGKLNEYPWPGRDEMMEQMPSLKKKFLTYRAYAQTGIGGLLTEDQLKQATILRATNFKSCLVRNDGAGKFTLLPLPFEAQLSTINGMVVDDFNGDGNQDLLLAGNDFGNEVLNGRLDGSNGLLLLGKGDCSFRTTTMLESGISLVGDNKSLVKLRANNGSLVLGASEHLGPMHTFRLRKSLHTESFKNNELYAVSITAEGKSTHIERYRGSSFISASGDGFIVAPGTKKLEFFHSKGQSRVLNFK